MITITAKRGIHVRPSRILEEKIKKIKQEVYFIHKGVKKKISSMADILKMEIAEGDHLIVDVHPYSQKIQQTIYDTIRTINALRFE